MARIKETKGAVPDISAFLLNHLILLNYLKDMPAFAGMSVWTSSRLQRVGGLLLLRKTKPITANGIRHACRYFSFDNTQVPAAESMPPMPLTSDKIGRAHV